jgi:hypothetical protein
MIIAVLVLLLNVPIITALKNMTFAQFIAANAAISGALILAVPYFPQTLSTITQLLLAFNAVSQGLQVWALKRQPQRSTDVPRSTEP